MNSGSLNIIWNPIITGHMVRFDQSEASIQVTWSFSTNKRPVSRSLDHSRPIRGQYQGQEIPLDQWEARFQVTWSLSITPHLSSSLTKLIIWQFSESHYNWIFPLVLVLSGTCFILPDWNVNSLTDRQTPKQIAGEETKVKRRPNVGTKPRWNRVWNFWNPALLTFSLQDNFLFARQVVIFVQ